MTVYNNTYALPISPNDLGLCEPKADAGAVFSVVLPFAD